MSVFDQRGQTVTYQYNANGSINFGMVQNRVDVVSELKKLHSEVIDATANGAIEAEVSNEVKYLLDKAMTQAQKPDPDKKTIMDHLAEAKNLMAGLVSVAGLVKGISEAIETVRKFF